MTIEKQEDICYISDAQNDLVAFLMKLTHEYKSVSDLHIVIDLLSFDTLNAKQINTFKALSKMHKASKKSFVIISKNIDYDTLSEKLSVVPTKIEAIDIIEMENIERDLGF